MDQLPILNLVHNLNYTLTIDVPLLVVQVEQPNSLVSCPGGKNVKSIIKYVIRQQARINPAPRMAKWQLCHIKRYLYQPKILSMAPTMKNMT
ncbi:hypothetical protein V1477_007812 [Vespula maculifrons]|uniref:Uncharacterized protein n=1 Tax=Vespula maculifrons TaxID=7453 RepID=A0ABD2CFU2_VESMC